MNYNDYKIVEYCNSFWPEKTYYRCTIDNTTYASSYLEVVEAWRKEMVDTTEQRAQAKLTDDIACASFMADVKIKD
jgi:hypothetical protein